jgi:hypothetical protein
VVVFCEAAADFRTATDLIDRVIRAGGPAWVGDLMEITPADVRTWHRDPQGQTFFDIHDVDKYRRDLGVRARHGHFDGAPNMPGALMASSVFRIVRALRRIEPALDGVVLLWDLDQQPDERRRGVAQAVKDAKSWADFEIVAGLPCRMREAWVLAGFVPADDDERARLADLRRELGFSPIEESHQLDAQDETAKRSAKRVLGVLIQGDADREARCWQEPSLEILRARGEANGLASFLEAVAMHLASRAVRG